jgi:uncharacterized membrane protein YkoI
MIKVGVFLALLVLIAGCATSPQTAPRSPAPVAAAPAYHPSIDPAQFTTSITNKYFSLASGQKFIYEGTSNDGKERNEVVVTSQTKQILGVTTIVVSDRVWLNGELKEDTSDWYAQDKDGNVWYFGEDSKEIVDGQVASTEGSWEAGVDGAQPGIIMEGNPKIGDSYKQEYYASKAEDMADVVALDETVTTPYGTFTNCLKTREWTPLESGDEFKWYCAQAKTVVRETAPGEGEESSLVNITTVAKIEPVVAPPIKVQITEDEAKAIALQRVPGTVTDIVIETKFGKPAYVVEIKPDYGVETDVIIDIKTGEVLGVET